MENVIKPCQEEKKKMWQNVQELVDITLFEELGKGGCGVVYRAVSNSLGPVAAKTLHILLHPDTFHIEAEGELYLMEEDHFRQEVETMMKFSHPNIVKCFGVWFKRKDTRKIPHMIFELGECAFDAFLFSNKISQSQAIEFAIQIVKGIQYLHTEHSTAHRDIKPGNMVLFKQENQYAVKLIDFGESKHARNMMKTMVGTCAYRDPKVGIEDYDKSVDVYAFGCVLVHMFCGYEALCKWRFAKGKQEGLPADVVSKLGEELSELVRCCIQQENRIGYEALLARFEAIRALTSHAQKVEPMPSQFEFDLALKFYYGDGVNKDLKKAVELFTTAANQGHSQAQHNLGYCYQIGEGVEKNIEKAAGWYTVAANQGLPSAQYNLAYCYEEGEGVEKNLKKAVEWYTAAANQGYSDAQYNLAYCYEKGEGVEKNLKKAVEWFTAAANQGLSDAQYNLGVCYQKGERVEKNMEKAVELFTAAANQGHSHAQFYLGVWYDKGEGVEKDLKKAVEWYTAAANQGYSDAQYNLAYCYEKGEGVEKNLKKAVELFTAAANQGDSSAQYKLALCYQKGEGVEKNLEKAMEWFTAAANQGHADAKYNLGVCYENEETVEHNWKNGVAPGKQIR